MGENPPLINVYVNVLSRAKSIVFRASRDTPTFLTFRAFSFSCLTSKTLTLDYHTITPIYSCGNSHFASWKNTIQLPGIFCAMKTGAWRLILKVTGNKVPAVALILLRSRLLSVQARRAKRSFWEETNARPAKMFFFHVTSDIFSTFKSMSN